MERLKLKTVVDLLINLGIDFCIAVVIKYGIFLAMARELDLIGVYIFVLAISFLVNMSYKRETKEK